MAATRTYFALLRTGLAIAGGGALITTILADDWPDWLVGVLAGSFIIVGFTIMIAGLQRYILVATKLAGNDEFRIISPKLLILLTAVLQITTLAVLALFLIGD